MKSKMKKIDIGSLLSDIITDRFNFFGEYLDGESAVGVLLNVAASFIVVSSKNSKIANQRYNDLSLFFRNRFNTALRFNETIKKQPKQKSAKKKTKKDTLKSKK